MTRAQYRSKSRTRATSSDQFFLYVAFHSAWTAVVNFFQND